MINDNQIHFNHYKYLFSLSNDQESLDGLLLLKKKCPSFDFSTFKVGIFTTENIEKFGWDFLIKNYEYLSFGLMEIDREKIDFILNNKRLLKLSSRNIDKLSIEILQKINDEKDIDIFDLYILLTEDKNFIDYAEIIFSRKNVTAFLGKNFEFTNSTFLSSELISFIIDNNSLKLINLIDKTYITSKTQISFFVHSYQRCKHLIDIVDNDNIRQFNDLLFVGSALDISVLDKFQLENYFEIKHYKVINSIDRDLEKGKQLISKQYFNIDYKNLIVTLRTCKKCKLFNKYTELLEINTLEDLKQLLSSIKADTNIYKNIEDVISEITKRSLVSYFNGPFNGKENIIPLNGEDFSFLIHAIKGYGKRDLASLLSEDPSYWHKNCDSSSYISTSYIDQNFFGLSISKGTLMGFTDICSKDILYMGVKDIYSSTKQVRNDIRNGESCYILPEDFSLETDMAYNEVTLKRARNGKVLNPNLLLAFDSITTSDETFSQYFKIPIYVLNSIKYFNKMKLKQEKLLENDELDLYMIYLKKMFLSFLNNYEIIFKHFNSEELEKQTMYIINKYKRSTNIDILKKVETIINLFSRLINSFNYANDTYIEYDTEHHISKLHN